jgi:predicted nucleotidyltransferase
MTRFNASWLFPDYRKRVLGLLLLHPDTRYHVREIARLTGTFAGSAHRELSKLAKVGLLNREVSGHQVYYQANRAFPIFEELASILRKTSGLCDILASALAPLAEKIEFAFIFGSVARGTETLGSDIDLLIVGEVSYGDVVVALYPAQTTLGREINPKIYRKTEWLSLMAEQNPFVQEVLNNKKLFIIGSNDEVK